MRVQKRLPRKFKKKCKKDLILSATYLNQKPISRMLEFTNRRYLTALLIDRNSLATKTKK